MENTTANNETALLFVCGGILIFFILLGIAFYFAERFKDINYAKMEMHRAYDDEEYRYWRKELHMLYWCLIPSVNPDTVHRFRRFFGRGKHSKPKQSDNIFKLLMPSLLGICICAVCLMGGTFAWFTASQSTATQTITAANYEVTTIVNDGTVTPSENGIYTLAAGIDYKVQITANGSATTGYCVIQLNDDEPLHTEQFPTKDDANKNSIVFTIHTDKQTTMQITARWGSSTKAEEEKIKNGSEYPKGASSSETPQITDKKDEQPSAIAEQTDDGVYTVKSGDTLSGIADKHKTTVEKLKAYNNLTSNTIQVGQKLNIPPADYEIPKVETPAESSPTATEEKTQQTETSTEETTENQPEE